MLTSKPDNNGKIDGNLYKFTTIAKVYGFMVTQTQENPFMLDKWNNNFI
jgi:hypothetical protein